MKEEERRWGRLGERSRRAIGRVGRHGNHERKQFKEREGPSAAERPRKMKLRLSTELMDRKVIGDLGERRDIEVKGQVVDFRGWGRDGKVKR